MSTLQMSTDSICEKLRELREQSLLPLRKVASIIDIDTAILSKMERGERKLTKEVVLKLAKVYNYNQDELLVLFLSDKIIHEILDEDLGEMALRIAKKKVKYIKANRAK